MKSLFLLSAVLMLTQFTSAQPSINWQRAYGGDNFDGFDDIKQTSDGGYIIVGESYAVNGDVTGLVKGMADIYIVKTSSSGTIEWDTNFGGSQLDIAQQTKNYSSSISVIILPATTCSL